MSPKANSDNKNNGMLKVTVRYINNTLTSW